jgi:hypothetical protein
MPLPPIRNKLDKVEEKHEAFDKTHINSSDKDKKLKRDTTPMFDYYKAWDKFTKEEVEKNDEPTNPVPEPEK